MRISRIRIENFRSIKALDLDLSDTTVLIGQNNAGKTAILDAIRIALTRRWGQRGTGFTEYDIHLTTDTDDPKQSSGVLIEVRVEEATDGEWPEALQQELDDIVQVDPVTGRSFISLRVTCAWNATTESFEPAWNFLNAARAPLIAQSARRINLERFWQYLPVFYLGALRDAEDEFSSRSQFWGRLLKAMKIPTELEMKTRRVLDLLNKKLLQADPRLAQIANTLSGATRVAARDREGAVNLRLVPLKSWDILSKAEIILRNEPDWPWLPLQRHGQGVQSLSVIFLFQAFVEHLLGELYEPESSPVLALEEPETHLHPQAARTLWNSVQALKGQKVVTTHSPYFVQHVPFRDLRMVHLGHNGTTVCSLPAVFKATIPHLPALDALVTNSAPMLTYDRASQELTVHGELSENRYRDLQTLYGTHPERTVISGVIRDLRDRSLLFIPDAELKALETFARRIRGEIFFAKRWFIVEGQAEYLIVHALAKALGYDLDEHGVAVIDAVNNGNPATFAVLARALSIPWLAVFDGDGAGQSYCDAIQNRNFTSAFVTARCRRLPAGHLEQQLLADGLEQELRDALVAAGHADAATLSWSELEARLDKYKTTYAAELAARLALDATVANRMPQAFRDAIAELRGLQ
ncbi:ATP-dependent nuclease [Bradyrhizobium ivorense]|uniref:ATP-dependent nuclease n=1 Tax=Bradyrhizobium ivorense TaxID=2511166 RepID=UPI0010B70D52|nr:AAA family ATPase [Bradyrhizobium ivorense]VIO79124.1 DNA replication and repair protein RecF [Bradyrhizobium ivorense]